MITFFYDPSRAIRDEYNINWEATPIQYLGVTLPQELGQLNSSNYDKLLNRIKSVISRWNLIPYTSIPKRVEVIKINVLSRFLYLFHSLPVEVPDTDFKEWDKLISRYIWQGRMIGDENLCKHIREGANGMESALIKMFLKLYESGLGRRLISNLYKGLEDLKGNNTRYITEKWEKEANVILSVDDREEIVGQHWRSTCSLSWREHGWKTYQVL